MVLAAAVVVTLMPFATRRLTQLGVVDVPAARSSHAWPTPRGAGLVTGPALGIALVLGWDPITVGLSAVALAATLLGSLEDLRGIGVGPRIAGQVAIGGLFLAFSWWTGTPLTIPGTVVMLVFIVGYTNAFNFMDGINGISASTTAVIGVAYVAVAQLRGVPDLRVVGAVLAVTALCFLPFNFPTARIFLGDSGSYSFGAVIACTAVAGWRAGIPLDAMLSPLAIYLGDTGTVVAKRLIKGESVTAPHRSHAYQRVARLRSSHAQSVAVVLICTVTTAGMGLAALDAGVGARIALDCAIAAVVALYLQLPKFLAGARHLG